MLHYFDTLNYLFHICMWQLVLEKLLSGLITHVLCDQLCRCLSLLTSLDATSFLDFFFFPSSNFLDSTSDPQSPFFPFLELAKTFQTSSVCSSLSAQLPLDFYTNTLLLRLKLAYHLEQFSSVPCFFSSYSYLLIPFTLSLPCLLL